MTAFFSAKATQIGFLRSLIGCRIFFLHENQITKFIYIGLKSKNLLQSPFEKSFADPIFLGGGGEFDSNNKVSRIFFGN